MTFIIAAIITATLIWLAIWMFAQKPVTSTQKLIQQHRYEEAIAAARPEDHLHRAEALKLLGRFEEAIAEYRQSDDPAAREGIALSLAHLGRDLDEAKRLMEETIALHPQIQEFQALALAYVLLERGERDEALRLFDDNLVLLQTRFRDDYTDPDPLLAETLWLFAQLSTAADEGDRAAALLAQARAWAPGSVWAR
jgi:tetratricopeptide (TPR) repeat protein